MSLCYSHDRVYYLWVIPFVLLLLLSFFLGMLYIQFFPAMYTAKNLYQYTCMFVYSF